MTTEQQDTKPTGLALLRAPFPENQISYLPKGGARLAYVGHAALTDRLLDADPAWTWEPLSLDQRGLPALDDHGGLWIKLTVCGITRLGYGDAGQKKGGDAMKERIGDALRNAAMRFGAALDLWHKGELHAHQNPEESEQEQPRQQQRQPAARQDKGGQDIAQVAHRIVQQIAAGNADAPAAWLATLPEARCTAIMGHLTPEQHDAITAAWPDAVTDGAAA